MALKSPKLGFALKAAVLATLLAGSFPTGAQDRRLALPSNQGSFSSLHSVEVKGVRFWSQPDFTRVVVDLEAEVRYEFDRLSDPERLYFDLFGTRISPELAVREIAAHDAYLNRIRIGETHAGVTRIVLDLNAAASQNVFVLKEPPRLVVELRGPAGTGEGDAGPRELADSRFDTTPNAHPVFAHFASIFAPAKEATAKPPAVSRAAPPSGGPKAEAGPAEKPTKPSLATSQPSPTPPISPAAIVPETSVGLAAMAKGGVTLSGTLEDQTGAVIIQQKLRLISKATGQVRQTLSDGSGSFSFNDVMPGEYILKGEAQGFRPAEQALTVGAKPPPDIKLQMEVSSAEEQVTVTARGTQPESSENNADAVYLNSEYVESLPTQGHDLLPVLTNFLSPAAQGASGPSIVVDGIEGSDLDVPADALRRVYVNKNPYSAEYRRPGSARIEVITRNGYRSRYESNVAFFTRNAGLDARNTFAVNKPDVDRRLFEASLGGPLPFSQTRFFLSGSRLRSNETAIVNALTPAGLFLANVPTSQHNTNLLGRVDLQSKSLNTLTLFYSFRDKLASNEGVGGLRLPEQGTGSDDRRHKFQLSDTAFPSPRLLNILRFSFERRNKRLGNPADSPAIQVRGAFTGGPSQSAQADEETRLELQDVAAYTRGAHSLRFGGGFRPRFFNFTDATNFGGTFVFSSLSDFAARRPILFQVIQGQPAVSFRRYEAYGFFQDEVKINPHITLMMGVRYDWQAEMNRNRNFAPRLALAFAPGNKKTVLRAGAGIFYDRLPETAVERSILLDGIHAREFVIRHPAFPNPFGGAGPPASPSVWRLAPDIQAPYYSQASLGIERKLWGNGQFAVEYQMLRGVHLFRARNINAPLSNGAPLPDPNFLLIREVESSAGLWSHALITTFQGRLSRFIKIKAQYAFSHANDDTNDVFDLPANNYDLRPEWGRATFDRRHRLNLTSVWFLPWGFQMGSILTLTSRAPFNITTGFDDNGDGVANDRPPGVTRNTGQGPSFTGLDVRFSKRFRFEAPACKQAKELRAFRQLELVVDAFNVLNHPNLTNVVGEVSSSLFGKATAALPARTIQVALRFSFRACRE